MTSPTPRHAGDRRLRRTLNRPSPTAIGVALVLAGWLGASLWSIASLRINLATFADSIGNAVDFVSRTLPLDFPPFADLMRMTGQTLAIVTCATVLSVVLSAPVSLAAARNTSRSPALRWAARAVIVITRAIPEIVLAILFLRLFGLGPVAGILALGIHSVGMVGKLYADAIEDTDAGPRDALRAAGASWSQQVTGAVVPQAMPAFVATALHRFDINLRASVILGYVGVGGIGMELSLAMKTLDYQRGMALALFVMALCIIVEMISGAARRSLLGPATPVRAGLRVRIAARVTGAGGGWVDARPGSVSGQALRTPTGGYRISPPWTAERIRRTAYLVVTATVLVAATVGAGIDLSRMSEGFSSLWSILGLFVPPSTGGIGDELLAQLLVTVQIAFAATFLGLVLALPIGVLAARNVAPTPGVARFFRIVIVLVRGIPDLIFAIIFIVITGLGATAGALALSVGAVGLLGKLIADSLEESDVRVQQAVSAGGATRIQVFGAATLRQCAPPLVTHLFYQLDVNIRAATLLGVVGAGGIGFYLMNAARVMQFDVVTMIVLMVFAVVMVVEGIAMWMRRALS
ncbi:phosphonate ABC transporter, permease protein PhnE [Rhodococcus sp. NPDC058532]|uniref:phosphonate ABC transporter, permease protein PhnE n=1 Tax=Rhodococcus sp. NPDC058532 TaxID=3346540 RepID=UPI003667004C